MNLYGELGDIFCRKTQVLRQKMRVALVLKIRGGFGKPILLTIITDAAL
jgi:hypothetical protein